MDIYTIIAIASPAIAAGSAWGGAKVALNGTRLRVKELEQADKDKTDRLARIETKIDLLLEKH